VGAQYQAEIPELLPQRGEEEAENGTGGADKKQEEAANGAGGVEQAKPAEGAGSADKQQEKPADGAEGAEQAKPADGAAGADKKQEKPADGAGGVEQAKPAEGAGSADKQQEKPADGAEGAEQAKPADGAAGEDKKQEKPADGAGNVDKPQEKPADGAEGAEQAKPADGAAGADKKQEKPADGAEGAEQAKPADGAAGADKKQEKQVEKLENIGVRHRQVPFKIISRLKQIPIVKSCIEKWRKQPPKTTGGIYYSDNEYLQRHGWEPFGKSKDYELLRNHIQYLLDEGLLFTSFYHCNIRAIDLMWSNKDGTGPHVEEAEVAPAGFAVISLAQYMESSFADFEDAGYYTLKLESLSSSNASSMDLKVEVNDIYSLEGAALKDFTHMTKLQAGSLGKVHLRISFVTDDDLSPEAPPPKHYPAIARPLSDLEAELWLSASIKAFDDHVSAEKAVAIMQNWVAHTQTEAKKKIGGLNQCLEMTRVNALHVAKAVLDQKYFLGKSTQPATDASWRKLFSADIKDMQPLRLNLLANPPDHKSNEDATEIGGSVYGGRCFSDDKMCKGAALEYWDLARKWPAARASFWHSDAANDYMIKMVLHLDGHGLVTLPLPKLVGSIEDSDANRTVLTNAQLKKIEKERRGNVLVIDEYGPHLQKTKQPHKRASSPVLHTHPHTHTPTHPHTQTPTHTHTHTHTHMAHTYAEFGGAYEHGPQLASARIGEVRRSGVRPNRHHQWHHHARPRGRNQWGWTRRGHRQPVPQW
jgi:hypothetical protein